MDPLDEVNPPTGAAGKGAAARRGPEPGLPATPDGLTVSVATEEDWNHVIAWADGERWNVGRGDAALFLPTDPAGFFVGRMEGRPVSAMSVVNYSARYAFLGHYLVDPAFRGRGLGLATWQAAVPHARGRSLGLDATPARQDDYAKSGFVAYYDTVRHTGRPQRAGAPGPGTVPVTGEHLAAVLAYDRQYFPTDRADFVQRWLTAPGHVAYARLTEGRLTGYGVIRPASEAHRIGPLFAETRADAEALFDALTAHLGPGDEVSLDIPAPQKEAGALAIDRGLAAEFHTVRMYSGPVPANRAEQAFATTTLELG
ncbi:MULTISPECIES: GNAT family N-acetyltransferase [Streptomyces]|uniref:GNAT family N-acetyltransferase n=1 Tax=Streptomyces luteosporeus TaxID=173856 RepID=A0ABN3TPW1_9ACTN